MRWEKSLRRTYAVESGNCRLANHDVPALRLSSQPVFAGLVPRQPLLFALSDFVVVPGHEGDDAKGSNYEEHENDDEEGSAESRSSGIASAESVMVMVVHLDSSGFDSAITAWIGWRVCVDHDSFLALETVSTQNVSRIVCCIQPFCVW